MQEYIYIPLKRRPDIILILFSNLSKKNLNETSVFQTFFFNKKRDT